jgi:hypothetical protein
MNIGDCKHTTIWDYTGWQNMTDMDDIQPEWNKTLITRINQVSTQIHRSSLRRGGDTVIMNPKLIELLSEYYYDNGLLNRYRVELDESMDLDIIFVCNRTDNTTPQMVVRSVRANESEIPEVMVLHERQCTPEEVLEYKKSLCGYITIQNYYSNSMNPRKNIKKLKL